MIRSPSDRVVQLSAGLFAVVFLCIASVRGQKTSPVGKQATHRISGRVVSAVDGHALGGAIVSLSNVRGGALVQAVVAEEGGVFAFEALPAGKYSLLGQRRGFVDSTYEEHEQFSTAIVTGAGIDTERLVLRLGPAATISGRVLDEDGEPVRGAIVTLYREGHEAGRKQTKTFNSTQTDPFGEFAFSQLRPGRYMTGVRATPWYAVAQRPLDPQSPVLTGTDPALDVAYPLTFFGNVVRADDATPIALKAGDRFHAEIRLSPVRALKITLSNSQGPQGPILSSLQASVFDDVERIPVQIQQSQDGGSEIIGLAPAQYRVETSDQTAGNISQMDDVDLIRGSAAMDAQRGVSEGSLALNLVMDDGSKLPEQMLVGLRGSRPGLDARQALDADGSATFRGVLPDDYRFLIIGAGRIWQTIRIEEGDKILTQNHRLLAAGESASLRLIIGVTARSVEGLAVRQGKPMAGAMIVLVSVDAMQNTDLFRRDQTDLDGTFSLPDVQAGRYILLAIENGWKLEWGRPEVLAPFLANGVALEVSSTQRDSMHVAAPINVQLIDDRHDLTPK